MKGFHRPFGHSCMNAHAYVLLGACVQVDLHLAELTVKETLNFSARVLGPGTKKGTDPSALCSIQCLVHV